VNLEISSMESFKVEDLGYKEEFSL